MAGQVTNWVYKNIDKAYLVGSTPWTYNAVQDTQRDLWKHFSGTTLFKDKTVMLDNYYYNFELNSWSGLVLRPITGNNGWTAVCDFKLYEDDSKWKSSLQGIYGEYPILAAIRLIASGCGLTVSDVAWQNYLDDILEDVAGQLGITVSALRLKKLNTHIANVSGYNVAAYVDKHIVDMFIKAMHDAGMFDFTRDQIDEIVEGESYSFEPEATIEESIQNVISDYYSMASVDAAMSSSVLKDTMEIIEETFTPAYLFERFNSELEDAGVNLPEDPLCNIELTAYYNDSFHRVEFRIIVRWCKHNNDTARSTSTVERKDASIDPPIGGPTYEGTYLRPSWATGTIVDYGYVELNYYVSTRDEHTITVHTETYNHSAAGLSEINNFTYYTPTVLTNGGWIGCVSYTNYAYAEIFPEGITLQEEAKAPGKDTTSSNRWSNWTGRAKTIYGDTSRSPASYTFIPLGYGDIDYYDQSRVQGGVVYSNYYLDLLGVTLEMIDDYEPGVDPDPGEDPDPIIPDPEPTPDPTPDDDEMEMTANRLFKVHQVTGTQVDALGGFIYSSTFIEAIKNMFTEPMDAIIGCFVLNYSTAGTLPVGTTETLKLGSVLGGTGVTGQPITNQFMTLDFGHKTINEYYGNVEDYAPYSKAECFLPYIGFVDLDINEIMNSTVNIKYVIDIYTGCCLAKIFVTKGGATQELYNFNGNCAIMVPLTGRDFTNGLMNFTTGAIGVIGGAVTGNPVAAVLGAKSAIGNISSIRRSGSISSNVGALGCQKPFILIKRPKAYNAPNYNQFYGYPSNWTVSLGSCSGYTRVKEVHLDHIICTDAEREEINQLLHQGVIF